MQRATQNVRRVWCLTVGNGRRNHRRQLDERPGTDDTKTWLLECCPLLRGDVWRGFLQPKGSKKIG
jgi:hypothetical protein